MSIGMSDTEGTFPDWMGDTDIAFPGLGIYLENVPKTFEIFGVTIAWYGVLIGIGMLLAFVLISHVAKKQKMNPDDFYDVGLYILIFGILGARLYYVIFSWDYYKDNLSSIFNIRQGGLAIYGGLIAGFATMIIYCIRKKKNMFAMMDVGVLGVLVGQILGRWGNFMNREAFGDYSDGLFAMRLPVAAVRSGEITDAMRAHMAEGVNYIQVHPTFLYESMYNLALLILIYFLQGKKRFEGEVAVWYIGGYGIGRFFIEGLRTDQLLLPGTHLPVSQMLGIILFAAALITDIIIRKKQKPATK